MHPWWLSLGTPLLDGTRQRSQMVAVVGPLPLWQQADIEGLDRGGCLQQNDVRGNAGSI